MHKHIIVEDRRAGKPRSGGIITEVERSKLVGSAQRVYTMPVDPEAVATGAIAGFVIIPYGAGRAMPDPIPGRICPLALHAQARPSTLHWRARIQCSEEVRLEAKVTAGSANQGAYAGAMRLIADTAQGIPAGSVGVLSETAFHFSALSDDDYDGEGWVIGGLARSNPQQDGVYGYALHGTARGFRVLWAAISQVG